MRAAQLTNYGDQSVLSINEVATPQLAADQVLVEVRAAAMNPFDAKLSSGLMRESINMQMPATLGGDFAGVISAVGDDVSEWRVGQEAFGQANAVSGQGSWAEFAPVKNASLAPKPQNLDFVQAAALPLVTVSAYQALVETLQLSAGQKILIHGGAGGIGSMAIQLARHLGAHIATTVSTKDIDFVKQLGAETVIDFTQEDFDTVVQNCNAVFDTIGGETNRLSYGVLKPGGQLVSMVAQPDEALEALHRVKAFSQFTRTTTERLAAVTKLVEQGVLQPQIDKVFPLDKADEALSHLKTGHPRGKVVLSIRAS